MSLHVPQGRLEGVPAVRRQRGRSLARRRISRSDLGLVFAAINDAVEHASGLDAGLGESRVPGRGGGLPD